MKASAPVLVGLLLVTSGCQHRLISVTSDPPGAMAYLNGVEVGRTPVDVQFTWFGVYDVRLELEGYETLNTTAEAEAPLHEQPGFDLLFMALPGEDRTEIAWHFTLSPEVRDATGLVERAVELKAEYETTGSNRDREGADAPDQPER